jgi:hypothetical protein
LFAIGTAKNKKEGSVVLFKHVPLLGTGSGFPYII